VPPLSDRRTAEHLGARVALAAQRWRQGARTKAMEAAE
jgi:hypothetical protein